MERPHGGQARRASGNVVSVPEAKRVVTLLRGTPPANIELPIERDGVRILTIKDHEVFTDYVATPKGPVSAVIAATA